MPFTAVMPTPLDVAIGHVPGAEGAKPSDVSTDESWLTYFLALAKAFGEALRALLVANVVDQASAIGTTPIALGSAGSYALFIYVHVTQAASTSSSVAVTLSWIDKGHACSVTFPALVGNTVGTVDAAFFTMDVDQPGIVNYATAYASVGAVPMQHKLRIHAVRLP